MDAVIVASDSARDLSRSLACRGLSAFERLVLVDNGSRDRSADIARRAGAVVLRRPSKVGYGAAVNLGVQHTEGPIFAILNPDVSFEDPRLLSQLNEALRMDAGAAVAAPALRLPDGRLQDSARRVPTLADLLLRRLLGRRTGAVSGCGVVPWAVGACLLVRRAAFDQIGGFDEKYPLYFEDVDFCVRLGRAGWRVRFVPEVVFSHSHHAASRGPVLSRAARLHMSSAMRFYRQNPRHLIFRDSRPRRGV